MNSLGPNRRSWSTITHAQDALARNEVRNHIGSDAPASPAQKSKRHTYSARKITISSIPLLIFSFATFFYVTMIRLQMDSTSRNHAIRSPETKAAASSTAKPELIHIIQTRFMQHQPNLLSLGQARLELFQTFCLPSLKSQMNKNFLWIIRADPNLHPTLRDSLIKLLEGQDNYILLGSNYNPEGFGRESSGDISFGEYLRENGDGKEMSAQVYSGNVTLIQEAFDKSNQGAILLETRLDADDGLHRDFVRTVQSEARHLAADKDGLWRIWCINYNVEWHPLNPFPTIEAENRTDAEGFLVMYSDPSICVTPGLTFGYGKGASRSSIGSRLNHADITRKITPCTPDTDTKDPKQTINTGCFSRLSKLSPGAIRSRTTTSAGMDNVVTGDESHDKKNKLSSIKKNKGLLQKFNKQYFAQDKLWSGISVLFKVSKQQAESARTFIVRNTQKIAEDNLKGQCTPGHSCKNDTQSVLKSVASN